MEIWVVDVCMIFGCDRLLRSTFELGVIEIKIMVLLSVDMTISVFLKWLFEKNGLKFIIEVLCV